MNKKIIKELRIMLTTNFMAEIVGLITLYLSNIHSIKILSINILSFLFVIINFVGLVLILKFVKKEKKKKLLVLCSLVLEIIIIICNFLTGSTTLLLCLQVISDLLKFLVILNIYKNLKMQKNKKKKIIIITIISYIVSKISCIILNSSNGLTIRPIMTTVSIIGILITYTLFIKGLEKR